MSRSNKYIEYILEFKKENPKSFIFVIPESGNDVVIPKSQCNVFVSNENEELKEGTLYTVSINEWFAELKKIGDGGEGKIIKAISVKVQDLRDSAVRVVSSNYDFWFPHSLILNADEIPNEGETFIMKVEEWLWKKKIEEYEEEKNNPKTGRVVVKTKEDTGYDESNNQSENFIEDDIPF